MPPWLTVVSMVYLLWMTITSQRGLGSTIFYHRTISNNHKINPKPCSVNGLQGTCMFVWECVNSEGKPIGMCVDTFMFGSCCSHNLTVKQITQITDSPEPAILYTPPKTTTSTTQRPYVTTRPKFKTKISTTSKPTYYQSSLDHFNGRPANNILSNTGQEINIIYVNSNNIDRIDSSTLRPSAHYYSYPTPSQLFFGMPAKTQHFQNNINHNNVDQATSQSHQVENTFRENLTTSLKPYSLIISSTEYQTTLSIKPTTSPSINSSQLSSSAESSTPFASWESNELDDGLSNSVESSYNQYRPSWATSTHHPTFITKQKPYLYASKPWNSYHYTTKVPESYTYSTNAHNPYAHHQTKKTTTTTSTTTTTTTTTTTEKPSSTSPPKYPVPAFSSDSGKQCGVSPLHPRHDVRIVGGKNAQFGSWAWQVSVRRTSFFGLSSTHRCGGALLNENWIATAGHCVDDLLTSQIKIRVGDYDFSSLQEPYPFAERGVARKLVHPKYNFFTYEYDLAMVRLDSPLEYAPHIVPICLPGSDDLLIGENATVTGWGRLSEGGTLPSVLQEVSVPIVSNDKCKNMFLRAGRHEHIPDIFMCAGYDNGGRDSCQGDSGGPVQIRGKDGRYFLAGIISWGIGCAESNLPGVCTRISKFVPWILQIVT